MVKVKRFQQGEGPSRGLLRAMWNFAKVHWQLYTPLHWQGPLHQSPITKVSLKLSHFISCSNKATQYTYNSDQNWFFNTCCWSDAYSINPSWRNIESKAAKITSLFPTIVNKFINDFFHIGKKLPSINFDTSFPVICCKSRKIDSKYVKNDVFKMNEIIAYQI